MTRQENILARYNVLHELGRGATGAVYAARDRTTGALVALKRLDPALKHAGSARRLRHGNIVRIHDAGEAGGTVYVAMEMLEGESLRKIVDAGPLPVARAIRIAHDIASGLAYAHLEGVVHGAVKPSNVIVSRSGVAKITDFGIGQAGSSYLSPEQLRSDPVDHRSDIFSLGALFYEMLTHRTPFEGGSAQEILESIAHGKPPLPSELNPHAPPALDKIVLSMLAGQPAARMPGVPILLRDLQRLEEGLGLGSSASAGTDEPVMQDAPRFAEESRHQNRTADGEGFDPHEAMAIMERESRQERSSRSRPAIFAALAVVLAVLGIGLGGFMGFTDVMGLADFMDNASDPGERRVAASRMEEPPATAPEARPLTAPPPVAKATNVEDEKAESESLAVPAGKVRAEGTAQLILAVSPRGEIYINGEHHGTTPPITTFHLEPGMHRIEVRHASRRPFLTYMTVQAGDVRRIRHDFNAKRMRPPT